MQGQKLYKRQTASFHPISEESSRIQADFYATHAEIGEGLESGEKSYQDFAKELASLNVEIVNTEENVDKQSPVPHAQSEKSSLKLKKCVNFILLNLKGLREELAKIRGIQEEFSRYLQTELFSTPISKYNGKNSSIYELHEIDHLYEQIEMFRGKIDMKNWEINLLKEQLNRKKIGYETKERLLVEKLNSREKEWEKKIESILAEVSRQQKEKREIPCNFQKIVNIKRRQCLTALVEQPRAFNSPQKNPYKKQLSQINSRQGEGRQKSSEKIIEINRLMRKKSTDISFERVSSKLKLLQQTLKN